MKVPAQKVTKTVYLYITNPGDSYQQAKPYFCVDSSGTMDTVGWMIVAEQEITFDIPELDTAPGAIEILEREKAKMLADAQVKAGNIDDQIQSLLAIGLDSE